MPPRKTTSKKPTKPARVKPEVIYVRMKAATAQRLRATAEAREYPHTITSVAAEMIETGLEAVAIRGCALELAAIVRRYGEQLERNWTAEGAIFNMESRTIELLNMMGVS